MILATCTLELFLPACHSLKEKRSVVKSLIVKMRAHFNLSVAEVGFTDKWQRALIACAMIGSARESIEPETQRLKVWIEAQRGDFEILDYHIDLFQGGK